ncbi:PAB-dependent poly(A)-specific ribonuclease subunit [Venturia inaequalis]|nr:PAB-dependent poly(A)-specific ribonuclease subunit [Venturia inaequalis]
MDLEGLYVPHEAEIYTRQASRQTYDGYIRPIVLTNLIPDRITLPNKAYRKAGRPREKRFRKDNANIRIRKDSRRQGDTAAARSTRAVKKAKQDKAARAARIKKRNEDLERSTVGRALCNLSKDKSPKATSTQKTTSKTVPNLSSLAAKAAVTTAPIEISDKAASDTSDKAASNEATKITFSSRKEALVATRSNNPDIAEAAEMYLDPFTDQDKDEEEAEDVAQELFTLPLHQKRSAEEALDSIRSTTSSKCQRGPCRHCRNPDHAYAMCPDR